MTPFRKYTRLDEFFANYAYVFNEGIAAPKAWIAETTEFFADCFLAAGPKGTECGINGEAFREAIEKGYSYYQAIGIKKMAIDSQENTFLNEHYGIAKVNWVTEYELKGIPGKLNFTVIYLVYLRPLEYKIFAYITGDEASALKKAGLV